MSQATPQMRAFATRLMAYETGGSNSFEAQPLAAFHGCEKLRPHLVTLMGNGGFRALLSRALALASMEVPWLRAVQVKADGSLEGLEALRAQLDPDEYCEGSVVLLAQLLGLLVAFIGNNLTLRLVREVRPEVEFNDLNVVNSGVTNEKAK